VSVLDAVVEHNGASYYFIRNPTNLGLVSDAQTLELLQKSGFSNYAVVAERDFLDSYAAGGAKAVLTSPSVLR
jgi:phosphoketolase